MDGEATERTQLARAVFAFIHGMIILELNGRFPDDDGVEPAWRAGLVAFASLRRK